MKIFPQFTVAILAAALFAATASAQPASKITPTELLSQRAQLTNKRVTVEGVLTNAGRNYFSDLRVVLKDNKDSSDGVLVQPWLPTSTPPRPTGAGQSTATLSDYLGRQVRITGVLTDGVVKNVGPTKLLRVETVQIVD